jgi:hypothetical protein
MTYTKPCIQGSCEALESIQGTKKGVSPVNDTIDPSNPNPFLTVAAYEADE